MPHKRAALSAARDQRRNNFVTLPHGARSRNQTTRTEKSEPIIQTASADVNPGRGCYWRATLASAVPAPTAALAGFAVVVAVGGLGMIVAKTVRLVANFSPKSVVIRT